MSILEGVLAEELERIQRNIASYESLLNQLPKGYLSIQLFGGKQYAYRKKRQGKRILSEYLGPVGSPEYAKAQSDYQERKRVEANLREMRQEEKKLRKALRHYGKEKSPNI